MPLVVMDDTGRHDFDLTGLIDGLRAILTAFVQLNEAAKVFDVSVALLSDDCGEPQESSHADVKRTVIG